jgi:hypothetical protein
MLTWSPVHDHSGDKALWSFTRGPQLLDKRHTGLILSLLGFRIWPMTFLLGTTAGALVAGGVKRGII